MRRALLAVVSVLSVLTLTVGCSGSAKTKPSGSRSFRVSPTDSSARSTDTTAGTRPTKPFAGTDFYAVPDPLPQGRHGTLLRYQPVTGPDGTDAYRIMYLSESVAGQPIAVTGTALVPKTAAPTGGRRVVTIAHGTTGIADQCAPSKDQKPGGELALMGPEVKAGYLMVESDYEGLGTPGRHPYLVGVSEGRGVIDAVPAAGELPGASASKDVAIAGYSQGGHGALWANQVAKDWDPSLHVVGTFAGAPATELDVIANAAPSLPGAAGFFLLVAGGFNAAYPEAKLDQVLTPKGIQDLDADDHQCVGQAIADSLKSKPGDLVKADAGAVPPWAALYKQNNPGQVATEDPILIIHSKQDDTVPVALSGILFDRMCGLHQVVERRVYDKGQGHVAAAPEAYTDGFAWIQDRFAGKPATSTCPAK